MGRPSLPIRLRITAAFALVMAVLLAAIAVLIYWSTSAALLDELDSGLRFRAAELSSSASAAVPRPGWRALQERGEAFDVLLSRTGTVLRATPGVDATALLGRHELATLAAPRFTVRTLAAAPAPVRLLALPVAHD